MNQESLFYIATFGVILIIKTNIMKRVSLFLVAVAFAMSSVTANAQLKGSEVVFNSFEVTYSPTTLKVIFLEFDINSVSADWAQVRALPLGYPLYLQYGAGLQYSAGEYGLLVGQKVKFLSAKVPVNVMYSLDLPNTNFTVMPYAGLNFRFNILGLNESDDSKTNMLNKDDMDGEPLNRFVLGWQIGAKVSYDRYLLGIGYEGPVTNLSNDEYGNKMTVSYVNISLGIKF